MPFMKPPITVFKRNLAGEVTWQYSGSILRREPNFVLLEARFNLPDTPFMDTFLKNNDRFVEIFYTDRWYNIFEMHDRDDDRVKAWCCNVGRPAMLEADDRLSTWTWGSTCGWLPTGRRRCWTMTSSPPSTWTRKHINRPGRRWRNCRNSSRITRTPISREETGVLIITAEPSVRAAGRTAPMLAGWGPKKRRAARSLQSIHNRPPQSPR